MSVVARIVSRPKPRERDRDQPPWREHDAEPPFARAISGMGMDPMPDCATGVGPPRAPTASAHDARIRKATAFIALTAAKKRRIAQGDGLRGARLVIGRNRQGSGRVPPLSGSSTSALGVVLPLSSLGE